jgi:hypothetical protein
MSLLILTLIFNVLNNRGVKKLLKVFCMSKKILCIFFILLIYACSKKDVHPQRVKIWFNSSDSKSKNFAVDDPTTTASISCVAVMIDYPSRDSHNFCDLSDSTSIVFDEMTIVTSLNNSLSKDVIIENNVNFHLLAFASSHGCPEAGPILSLSQQANLSVPFKIVTNTVDIMPSVTTVDLVGPFSGSPKITGCHGTFLNWIFSTEALWDNARWGSAFWGP